MRAAVEASHRIDPPPNLSSTFTDDIADEGRRQSSSPASSNPNDPGPMLPPELALPVLFSLIKSFNAFSYKS